MIRPSFDLNITNIFSSLLLTFSIMNEFIDISQQAYYCNREDIQGGKYKLHYSSISQILYILVILHELNLTLSSTKLCC